MRRGDRVVVDKGGGGGLGEPRRRPFAKIVADVLDGYVTRDAAIAAYEVDPQRLDEALRSWDAASAAPLSAAR
jgi:N-methylhydantoinase B/oxoprolinase/acetone carboxylase alpha subunit